MPTTAIDCFPTRSRSTLPTCGRTPTVAIFLSCWRHSPYPPSWPGSVSRGTPQIPAAAGRSPTSGLRWRSLPCPCFSQWAWDRRARGDRIVALLKGRRRVAIGLAGVGYWGSNVARNLARIPACELLWCCDTDVACRERASSLFPDARFSQDFEELLADESLDAVAIATPVPTHAAMAERAIEAGKHCFVEKPLAQSAADGRPSARVSPRGGGSAGADCHRRAGRAPLHLLPAAQSRQAPGRRERALESRRPRRLHVLESDQGTPA